MRAVLLFVLAIWAMPIAALEQKPDFDLALDHARAGEMSQAAHLFRQLAEERHTGAQINLAVLYARGMGVPHDELKAAYWAWHARLSGDRRAIDLADYLLQILPQSLWPDLATKLSDDLVAQAQDGEHAALVSLGVVATELADPAQTLDGYVWFSLAAAFDVPVAVDLRDMIAGGMDPDTRRSAQEAAQAAFDAHCARLAARHRVATCAPD